MGQTSLSQQYFERKSKFCTFSTKCKFENSFSDSEWTQGVHFLGHTNASVDSIPGVAASLVLTTRIPSRIKRRHLIFMSTQVLFAGYKRKLCAVVGQAALDESDDHEDRVQVSNYL